MPFNACYGVDDLVIQEAENAVSQHVGPQARGAVRAVLRWLRGVDSFSALRASGEMWQSTTAWSDGIAYWLPVAAEVLYEAYVVPVRLMDVTSAQAELTKNIFNAKVRGCIDSVPIKTTGRSKEKNFNGHNHMHMMKALVVCCTMDGLIEFAQGGFSGTAYDDSLLKMSNFKPAEHSKYLGDNHFTHDCVINMPGNAIVLRRLRRQYGSATSASRKHPVSAEKRLQKSGAKWRTFTLRVPAGGTLLVVL